MCIIHSYIRVFMHFNNDIYYLYIIFVYLIQEKINKNTFLVLSTSSMATGNE